MKKIVVIGSNSFSGSDFIDNALTDTNYEIHGVSRSPEKTSLFLPYKENANRNRFTFHQMDLNQNMMELKKFLLDIKPEYIINFAAQSEVAPSWEHPDQWFLTNAVAIARLGNLLKDQSWLERYVQISTPEIYGTCEGFVSESAPMNPSTPYAASKAAGDLMLQTLVKNYEFPLVTIRSTNVYGAHQQLFKIIPRSMIYQKLGKRIPLHGGGRAVKSFIHIRDISRGELSALEKGVDGNIYHLSPDQGISIHDLVQKICTLTGHSFIEAVEIVEERPGQDLAYTLNSSKARDQLGWQPVIDIDTGLHQVYDWINHEWDNILISPKDYQHKE